MERAVRCIAWIEAKIDAPPVVDDAGIDGTKSIRRATAPPRAPADEPLGPNAGCLEIYRDGIGRAAKWKSGGDGVVTGSQPALGTQQ